MSDTPHPEHGLVSIDRRGPVAVVTLGGEGRLEAPVRRALLAALSELDDGSGCRAIVLSAQGGRFPAISEATDAVSDDLFKRLTIGKLPVIVTVEGTAAGIGLSLAAACDYVVATPAARFEAAFGGHLPQGALYWTLARRIGAGRARQALLRGQVFTGKEALANGLANELADPGAALETAVAVAGRYAEMPPMALAWLKAAMATGSDTLDQAIETETNVQPLLRFSEDHNEAVAAFLQKRAPNFVGR